MRADETRLQEEPEGNLDAVQELSWDWQLLIGSERDGAPYSHALNVAVPVISHGVLLQGNGTK